ncbi:inositol 1,4,5-triphosphate receptor associated 1-like [Discoglossus pictus]
MGESSGSEEDVPAVPPSDLSVVETLRLHRLSLTEQDAEVAFAQLSLFLHCDTFTLSQRLQVEERARDIAEKNIQRELEEIRNALQSHRCSSPRCHSISRHALSALPILSSSVRRLSKAAERLGAVHQEARTSHAVELMVQHVENLRGRREPREESEEEKANEVELLLRQPGSRNVQAQTRRRISVSIAPPSPLGVVGNVCPGPDMSKGSDYEKQPESAPERSHPRCLGDGLVDSGFLDGQKDIGSCPRWSLRRMTDGGASGESDKSCDTLSCDILSLLRALLPQWFRTLLSFILLVLTFIIISRVLQLPSSS